MNTYRLLRNNKETGPFTSDELISHGFKPYDLIWVEGKSAGWRYPGEIPEFNVVAPVVELQPFERFVQKSSYSQRPETQVLVHANQLDEFNSLEQKLFTVPKTSIYVTLPGNAKGSTHRVILATKEFHKNKTEKLLVQSNSEEVVEPETKTLQQNSNGYFVQEEVLDSSLAISEPYVSSQEQVTEDTLEVEFNKKRSFSLFSKLSIAAAVLLFGFSLILFTNSLIQKRERIELAKMVQALKAKENTLSVSKKAIVQRSELPLFIDPQFIITTDALSIANEAVESLMTPVLNDTEVSTDFVQSEKVVVATPENAINKPLETDNNQINKSQPEALHPAGWLINQISIENSDVVDFSKDGISSTIVVTNNSPVSVSKAEVTITALDESNQVIKKDIVRIDSLAPGMKKEINFNKSAATLSLQYSISSISYKTTDQEK